MSHENHKNLLNALNECAIECSHCASDCLEVEDAKSLAKCIKLNLDCAEICRLAISFIARGSEHADHILKECADICEACAMECEKHTHLAHCKKCAEACRKCAKECLQTV